MWLMWLLMWFLMRFLMWFLMRFLMWFLMFLATRTSVVFNF